MPRDTLCKIWTTISLALCYITFNGWLGTLSSMTKGNTLTLPLNILSGLGRHATSAFGLLICSILLLLGVFVAHRYSTKVSGGSVLGSYPVAFGVAVDDFHAPEARAYQVTSFVLFMVFPVAGLVRFLDEFFSSRLAPTFPNLGESDAHPWGFYGFFGLGPFSHDSEFRCVCDGVAFFPFYEPLLLSLLSCAAVGAVAGYCYIYFVRPTMRGRK